MKKIILSLIIIPTLIITISLNSGCRYDEILPEVIDPTDTIYFSADIITTFNQSCNFSGCHAFDQEPPDLTPNNAYDALTNGGYIDLDDPEQSELYQWVNGNRSTPMPITGTDDEFANKVLIWIQQGALNN